MTTPKIGDVYVPSEGPDTATIMLVGEAPGVDEEKEQRPFVGKAGRRLDHYLQKQHIRRQEVFLTNLCKYRPYKNKFVNTLNTEELERGLIELGTEIERVKPNVIVAAGGWPLYHLTGMCGKRGPGSGIVLWRGSILPCSLVEGYKVLATLHPSYLLRNPSDSPFFRLDLGRAVKQSEFSEIRSPQYESIIDPTDDIIAPLVRELSEAEWLSVDIETFGSELACIGFTDSPSRAVCLTCFKPDAWNYAKTLLQSPAKKIFQFGTYDIHWLRHFYDWPVTNYAFDTYIAAATLMPEFKRGLDFLTSIYTEFPYYKEEGKGKNPTWKREGDFNILWEYNIKDVITTYIIAMEQMKELKEIFGD